LEEEGIFLFSQKRTPNISKISTEAKNRVGSIKLYHPPYSSILAPSDHYLFQELKKHLAAKALSSNGEVQK
jgi:hypothetical protein